MAYRVLVKLCTPDGVFKIGDTFRETRFGAGLIGPWLRDHWIKKVEEPELESEPEAKPIPTTIVCIMEGCLREYKTIKGFFAHVRAKHPGELRELKPEPDEGE